MAYFPFFTDIEKKNCLIVGTFDLVLEKTERLLPYGVNIYALAEDGTDGELDKLEKLGAKIIKEKFDIKTLDFYDFVVTCSLNSSFNKEIAEICKEKRIPINSVDDTENCTFIFPSLIKRGKLSVGISSSGASPYMTRYLKKKLNEIIPNNTENLLEMLEELRPFVKEQVSDEKKRKQIFKRLFLDFVDSEKLPDLNDVNRLISKL